MLKHILHIDDDEEDFLMLQEAVNEAAPHLEVTYLGDCPELIENPDFRMPDLLFLDINMHGNDGFYWLQKIREKGLTQLPVIIYSTASTQHYISKAYETGAHLFFIKPQTFTELVEYLQQLLQLDWTKPEAIRDRHHFDGNSSPFRIDGPEDSSS